MAIDKAIDSAQLDADLTTVADAIRTKGGTSGSLAFPAGFVSAVQAIETGGGNQEFIDLIARTQTHIESADVVTIGSDAFSRCNQLQSVSLPNAKTLYAGAFYLCKNLTSIYLPMVETITGGNAFNSTNAAIVLPSLKSLPDLNGINGINGTSVDLGVYLQKLPPGAVQGSTNLATLILRATSIVSLVHINAFSRTPFASGESGGTLYVPEALIDSYKSATNWSTILSYENNQILPIEDSEYEHYYADGTEVTA